MRIISFLLVGAIILTTLGQAEPLRAQDAAIQENVLSRAGDLPKQLAELNVKRKETLENILRTGQNINRVTASIEEAKNNIQFHFGADHYRLLIQALESVKSGNDSEGDRSYLENWGYEYSPNTIDASIRTLQGELQKETKEANLLTQLTNELQDLRNTLSTANQTETLIESRIDRVLAEANEQNDFRLFISVAFTLLVAFVIAGFYFIAFKNKVVADAFGGEKGIQFITLFLVVIAIILFGIMGVFGGKELSALLGALSGYILGRSTSGPAPSPPPK